MAFTFTFGPLSSAQTSWLDANFNAAGLLGTLPCSVTGTNALKLTPLSIPQPNIALQAMLRVSAIAVASNTGSVTASVNAGPVLTVYKDTPTGPAVLTGGEIVDNNYFVLAYDASLNAGAGGWHLETAPASAAGTVTSVGSGTGLTGGPITTSGTLSLANIASLNLLANITGGSAAPIANTLTAILDAVFSNTQGAILSRGASLWAANGETIWTPTLSFGGGSVGVTYTTQVGQQMQIGFLTAAMFNIVLSNKGSSTGAAAVSLPNTAGGSNRIGGGIVSTYSNLTSVTTVPFAQIAAGGSTAALVTGGSGTVSALMDTNFANNSSVGGFLFFFTG